MASSTNLHPLKHLKDDIPSSIIVFLVALPLCLGIALASGAPLYSGLISGIVGGIVVGTLSGSPLGVSGPAAGLAVIVYAALEDFDQNYSIFLVAVVLAGIIQVIMGFLKAGVITQYFPSSVIQGMLAGIGILIFVKQIPHAFGYDKDPEGDLSFQQVDGETTFSELSNMLDFITPGALLVSSVSLLILILWETPFVKNLSFAKLIKGPLVVVILGIVFTSSFGDGSYWFISQEHLVRIPVAEDMDAFVGNFTFPDFSALSNPQVYITAAILAVVASVETLLCADASDKQDSLQRTTPPNRELKAQGVGNIVCGLIGGLPVTQVIVRSSVNQQSGGKTKASAIIHGFLLILSILLIPNLLNKIPLATLAAILLVVGFKLAKPTLFKRMYQQGWRQFIPFAATVLGIMFTDLLTGIGLGMVVAIFIILLNNYKVPYTLDDILDDQQNLRLVLSEDVTFLNKASIRSRLEKIPDNSRLEIDASNTQFIHHDVLEIIHKFQESAKERNIQVTTTGLKAPEEHESYSDH